MKNGTISRVPARPGLKMISPQAEPKSAPAPAAPAPTVQAPQSLNALDSGIVVREEELGTVKAQRLYKMRCECGRSWFELELPKFVECPACKKIGLVSA